jgi:hypothetical protein
MKKKVCVKCKINQLASEFHKYKKGLHPRCKSCRKIDKKMDYENNKDKYLLRANVWAKNNRAKSNSIKYRYKIKKLKTDPVCKITYNLRRRLLSAIKEENKSESTFKLLGCSAKKLKEYLEDQFTEGMTWENYGYYGWHIDHIKPCASFDLSDPAQQKLCFHYSNLQPLWAKDNFKKGDKY